MQRHRRPQDSSLELLLDTICNTFGGVLFLAMLTSLMLARTQRNAVAPPANPVPAVSMADLLRLETRVKSASLELLNLREQVRQAQRAATDLSVPGADSLICEKEKAERANEQLRTLRLTLLADVASQQAAAARAAAHAASERRDRQQLDEQRHRAESRLEAAMTARETLVASAIAIRDQALRSSTLETTGRAPRMHSTNKQEIALMIKYGRLYALDTLRNGRATLNTAHFSLRPGIFMNIAEAKPYAGIDLIDRETRENGLREITQDLPPSMWYALLIVRSDSFEEYLTVKNWLVEHGYEYRLIPGDAPIHEGAVDVSVQ